MVDYLFVSVHVDPSHFTFALRLDGGSTDAFMQKGFESEALSADKLFGLLVAVHF